MSEKKLQLDDYISLLADLISAWENTDAKAVVSFYTDTLEYRDPSVPDGIFNKEDFIKYLELMFAVWPIQKWKPGDIFPHEEKGAFSGCYEFTIANEKTEISGSGIDRIKFEGNKICLNHVYLNAQKWNNWLKLELTGGV